MIFFASSRLRGCVLFGCGITAAGSPLRGSLRTAGGTRRCARSSPGCHWTPRQKRAAGSSIASITPSGAVADTGSPARSASPPGDAGCSTSQESVSLRRSRISRASSVSLSTHTSCARAYGLCGGTVQLCSSAPATCGRDVLHERAAAGDVQHLDAAADREDRQTRCRRASPISAISNSSRAGSTSTTRRVRRFAVARRRDVVAAGEQQAVDRPIRASPDRPSTDRRRGPRRRREGPPAGSPRSCGTRSMPMRGMGLRCWGRASRSCYIRAGTSIPIRSSARVSCERK